MTYINLPQYPLEKFSMTCFTTKDIHTCRCTAYNYHNFNENVCCNYQIKLSHCMYVVYVYFTAAEDTTITSEDDSDELPTGILVLIIVLCIIILILVVVIVFTSFFCYHRGLHSNTV